MYKSYYYLNRLTLELNNILAGKRIANVFSQEKDRLIIQLDDQDELYLEISVNHSDPYINVRNKFSRAKKNTIGFFSELVNNKIKEVLIASDDRIIKMCIRDRWMLKVGHLIEHLIFHRSLQILLCLMI